VPLPTPALAGIDPTEPETGQAADANATAGHAETATGMASGARDAGGTKLRVPLPTPDLAVIDLREPATGQAADAAAGHSEAATGMASGALDAGVLNEPSKVPDRGLQQPARHTVVDDVVPFPQGDSPDEASGSTSTGARVGDTGSTRADAAEREPDATVRGARTTAGGSVAATAPSPTRPGSLLPTPGVIPATWTAGAAVALAPAPTQSSSFVATPASATAGPGPYIDALAMAMAATSTRGIKHFAIRLDPPELGRVDVHLSVGRDGKAEAHLTVDRPDTLVLLQRDSGTLHRALRDAGLDLSNNSLNFSLKGQQRQGDGGGASMARTRSLPDAVVARAEAANASTPIWNHAPDGARLDIRV
jgi:hypothetical protein